MPPATAAYKQTKQGKNKQTPHMLYHVFQRSKRHSKHAMESWRRDDPKDFSFSTTREHFPAIAKLASFRIIRLSSSALADEENANLNHEERETAASRRELQRRGSVQ
jgi:hypothetical protein